MEENGRLLLCSQQVMPSMSSSMDSFQVCCKIFVLPQKVSSSRNYIPLSLLGYKFCIFLDSNPNIITGSAFGTREQRQFTFTGPVNLRAGINKIALLSIAVGLPVSALSMTHRFLDGAA